MSKLSRVSGKQFARFLQRKGYELVRIRGSHHTFRDASGKIIVVPIHGNRPIPIGTLSDLVTRRLEMTPEEFRRALKR